MLCLWLVGHTSCSLTSVCGGDLGLLFWPWLDMPHTSPHGCSRPQAWPVSLHRTHSKLLAQHCSWLPSWCWVIYIPSSMPVAVCRYSCL